MPEPGFEHEGANPPIGDELGQLRDRFVSDMWRGLFIVASIAVPVTFWRASFTGWLPLYYVHLGLCVAVAAFSLLQHRIAASTRGFLLVAMLWAIGLPGLMTLGLAAPGLWWLVMAWVVVGVVYSVRAATVTALATALAIGVVGVGFVRGWLEPPVSLESYIQLPSSWATLVVVIVVSAWLLLRALSAYLHATAQLVRRLREQRDEIERLSLHDRLTGLPQASLANDRLDVALHAARRNGGSVAVLYIDLDGFKQVNDSLGHDAGDVVLRNCADRLRSVLRKEDTVARLGGDEFLVVVALRQPEEAETVAAKLLQVLEPLVDVEGRQVRVGASIGIACHPEHGADGHSLRRHADAAMYEAKRLGRQRYAWAWKPGSPRDAVQMAAHRPTTVDAD